MYDQTEQTSVCQSCELCAALPNSCNRGFHRHDADRRLWDGQITRYACWRSICAAIKNCIANVYRYRWYLNLNEAATKNSSIIIKREMVEEYCCVAITFLYTNRNGCSSWPDSNAWYAYWIISPVGQLSPGRKAVILVQANCHPKVSQQSILHYKHGVMQLRILLWA